MTQLQRKPELLAPAGSPEKLRAALLYGADAVYLAGEQFGLRAFAANFTREELAEAVTYTHGLGRKLYVTANIYAHQEDLADLPEYLRFLDSLRVDGILISDPGIFALAEEYAPNIPRQISTQASLTNASACRFWYDRGVRRVVLARELTLQEIRSIRDEVPEDLEIEAFVHGAMCMAYSGRCMLSQHFVQRDGNRGRCAQPCRWKYEIHEVGHPERSLELEEDSRGSYLLSSRDLCLIEHIPELVEAGINSFKIEGRIKGAYYAAAVTRVYRQALDAYFADPEAFCVQPEWMEELCAMVHRPFGTGFYFDRPQDNAQIASEATYVKEAVVLARTTGLQEKGWLPCSQRNKFRVGEQVEILPPKGEILRLQVSALRTDAGEPIPSVPHAQMAFQLQVPAEWEIPVGSFIRKWGDKDQDPESLVAHASSCSGGCASCSL